MQDINTTVKSTMLLFLWLMCGTQLSGQNIGIGTSTPNENAMLDIQSSTKGILIPRIDYANRPTGSVEKGMMIFVTTNGPMGNNVFYYYDGSNWLKVKNSDDNQTLSLSNDTLAISGSNYVVIGNILNLIGYYKCSSTYTAVASDANNCGACGNACSFPNASSNCISGNCVLSTCNAGFGNCDANSANGCETNLLTSVTNCGACGNVCSIPNAVAGCGSGNCFLSTCNAGFGNCDANLANGCETNILTSLTNCGGCGNVCPSIINGTAACVLGNCTLSTCNVGFGNCDANFANGCETDFNTSTSNCGACGRICSFANAFASCNFGNCVLGSCLSGFGNCDGNSANGCETNLKTSNTNCNACGVTCPSGTTCQNGVCL